MNVGIQGVLDLLPCLAFPGQVRELASREPKGYPVFSAIEPEMILKDKRLGKALHEDQVVVPVKPDRSN